MTTEDFESVCSICRQLNIDISKLNDNDLTVLESVLKLQNKYPKRSQKIEIKAATLEDGGILCC